MNRSEAAEILGVPIGASPDEAKRAYKKLSMIHHPDRNMDAEEAVQDKAASNFKRLKAACDEMEKPPRQFTVQRQPLINPTIRVGVGVDAMWEGTPIEFEHPVHQHCNSCDGRGFSVEAFRNICRHCDGAGTASLSFGHLISCVSPCGECNGRGFIIDSRSVCGGCEGHGHTTTLLRTSFPMPRVDQIPGYHKIPDAGSDGSDGARRPLTVHLVPRSVKPFIVHRGKFTIICESTGRDVEVPLPDGSTHSLKLPRGFSTVNMDTLDLNMITVPDLGFPTGGEKSKRDSAHVAVNLRLADD